MSIEAREKNLLELVLDGDLEDLRKRLKEGANVNQAINGVTPVFVTAFRDDQEKTLLIFQELMKHNVNLDVKATIGRNVPDMTPLHFACAFSRTALAQAMVDADANVNALDGHGQTSPLPSFKLQNIA